MPSREQDGVRRGGDPREKGRDDTEKDVENKTRIETEEVRRERFGGLRSGVE